MKGTSDIGGNPKYRRGKIMTHRKKRSKVDAMTQVTEVQMHWSEGWV